MAVLSLKLKKQGSAGRIVFYSIRHNIFQYPQEGRFVQHTPDGFIRNFDFRYKAAKLQFIVLGGKIFPQYLAQIQPFGLQRKLRMLQLTVFMEGVDQTGKPVGFLVDGVQIFRYLFRRN